MITPQDIRQHVFGKSLRGYNTAAVRAFLNSLAGEWEETQETLKKTKRDLSETAERLTRTEERLRSFEEMEAILQKTLKQAEQQTRDALENAKKDAELKLQEAAQKSNEIISQAYQERNKVEREVAELERRKADLLTDLKSFFNTQLEKIHGLDQTPAKPRRVEQPRDRSEAHEISRQPTVVHPPAQQKPVVMQNVFQSQVSQVSQMGDGNILLREQKSFFDQLKQTPNNQSVIYAIADEL